MVIHGMEDQKNAIILKLYDPTVLSLITQQICRDHNYIPQKIRKEIYNLTLVNKFFHHHYTQEKTAQSIVRFCSTNLDSIDKYCNDEYIADQLGLLKIKNTISYFSTIVRNREKKFTENDLKNSWYLSSSTDCACRSILFIAIDHLNLEKAQQIIEHANEFYFYFDINRNILLKIANLRHKRRWYKSEESKTLLSIAESLLKIGIFPDGAGNGSTPLMDAAYYEDKLFANLLLEYGANPDIALYNIFAERSFNAFESEQGEPKGWLKKMVDADNNNKEARMILQQAEDKLCQEHNEALFPDMLSLICTPNLSSSDEKYQRLMKNLNLT